MINYLDLVDYILYHGERVPTRSGRCLKAFDFKLSWDLADGFPIVTTKKIHFKSVVTELLWFLKGGTDTKYLHEHGVTIWDEWADETGYLGPVYGHQWRNLKVDQIKYLIRELKTNPQSRRLLVNSWNVEQLHEMALPPCHYAFECYVRDRIWLDLKWHQRSVDVMLGLPFNISSYAILLTLLAKEVNLRPGKLIADLGNCHIYENHIEGASEQLCRFPMSLPTLHISSEKNIFELEPQDIWLENYDSHPPIKFEIAV